MTLPKLSVAFFLSSVLLVSAAGSGALGSGADTEPADDTNRSLIGSQGGRTADSDRAVIGSLGGRSDGGSAAATTSASRYALAGG